MKKKTKQLTERPKGCRCDSYFVLKYGLHNNRCRYLILKQTTNGTTNE